MYCNTVTESQEGRGIPPPLVMSSEKVTTMLKERELYKGVKDIGIVGKHLFFSFMVTDKRMSLGEQSLREKKSIVQHRAFS